MVNNALFVNGVNIYTKISLTFHAFATGQYVYHFNDNYELIKTEIPRPDELTISIPVPSYCFYSETWVSLNDGDSIKTWLPNNVECCFINNSSHQSGFDSFNGIEGYLFVPKSIFF